MDVFEIESETGVRMVWNNLPPNKLAATRSILPVGIHYTPYKDIENLKTVDYDPITCRCGGILNPYCFLDLRQRNKFWVCPFCQNKNPFPQLYNDNISETQLPLELQIQNTTLEYLGKVNPQAPNQGLIPQVFLFVIDTCISEEDMEALKTSIQESIEFIPQDSYVGLITYGRYVFVHELGFQECPKSYAIKGNKEYTSQQIQEMLGLQIKHDPRGTGSMETIKRFLLKLEDCKFNLNTIIDNLSPDPWVVESQKRQQRAVGTALNVAVTLAESCPYQGGRVLHFLGGPCTVGPGQVVEEDYAFTIRGYTDIQKENENCKFISKAKKYYNGLTQRAVKVQTVIDTYAFSVDQVGLMEMRYLSEKTGGYAVMNEEFNNDVFKQTYKKLFELEPETNDLRFATAAKVDLICSKELKVQGALGCCTSLKKTGPLVAEQEIGQGGTTNWFLGGIDRTTTITFMFDLQNNKEAANQQPNLQQKQAYFQFKTEYKAPNGRKKLRVTTIARKFADVSNNHDLTAGFDQEAACVAMARWGVWKCEQEESLEVLKWLDRTLIRLVSKFGTYNKDDSTSFRLSSEFSLYPQLMYHLRRSHFIQTFGSSPDEITFYRVSLNRENVTNCSVMIQPALLQYTLDDPQANPVTLDQSAIQNRVILLLDTYFQVITWRGDHIQQWLDEGYDEKEEFAHLKALKEAPLEDVKIIMEDRFPVPIFFETITGHTKERYLKSRINPSGSNHEVEDSGFYITDDASLKLFMDHLIKLAVQSNN